MTSAEAAQELGVSDRRMRALLKGGRVIGARQRTDGRWEIKPTFKIRAFSTKCKTYGRDGGMEER